MYLNILIIVFILAMAIVWSHQGLFSAFLHMMIVVAAGSLALALWEPLVIGLLIKYIPMYAWGVGLLALFGLVLLVLRIVMDKLVPMNMKFMNMVNMIGGGVCGVASGILTSGIIIIGLGFLPLPADILGYQPYTVNGYGAVEATNQQLWINVDGITSRFFTMLSRRSGLGGGAFNSSKPLAQHLPQMQKLASLFRMRYDPNASVVAQPDSVKVTDQYSCPSTELDVSPTVADAFGPTFNQPGYKVVAVDTDWQQIPNGSTYDDDRTLRLPPTQIRLLARSKQTGRTTMLAPVAFSQVTDQKSGQRELTLINTGKITAIGTSSVKETFAWLFIMPDDLQPGFLLARRLRLKLPAGIVSEVDRMMALLAMKNVDQPEPVENTDADPSVGSREGVLTGHQAESVRLTNELPAVVNKNLAPGLKFDQNIVMSGKTHATRTLRSAGPRVQADQIHLPSHKAMVRLEIVSEEVQSIFGSARALAANLQGLWLKDSDGNMWFPHAYSLLKQNGDQLIMVDPESTIRSASQLPLRDIAEGDKLYLYFMVDRGIDIVSYDVGNTTIQSIHLKVPG